MHRNRSVNPGDFCVPAPTNSPSVPCDSAVYCAGFCAALPVSVLQLRTAMAEVGIGDLQVVVLRHSLGIADPGTDDMGREMLGQLGLPA